MAAIAVLSDTHGVLDEALPAVLRARAVSHIVHGGDIGPGRNQGKSRLAAPELLARLQAVAPVHAIAGNVDSSADKGSTELEALNGPRLQISTADSISFELAGLRVWLSHGHRFAIKPVVGSGGALALPSGVSSAEARARIAAAAPDVVVCGHTHKPMVGRIEAGGRPVVFVNPGSAGPRRFSLPRAFAIMQVRGGRVLTVDRFENEAGSDDWRAVESVRFDG